MERPKVTLYGTTTCGDCERSKLFLKKQGIGFQWVDIDRDSGGRAYVQKVNNGNLVVPTIVFEDGAILVEPSNEVLGNKLGIGLG